MPLWRVACQYRQGQLTEKTLNAGSCHLESVAGKAPGPAPSRCSHSRRNIVAFRRAYPGQFEGAQRRGEATRGGQSERFHASAGCLKHHFRFSCSRSSIVGALDYLTVPAAQPLSIPANTNKSRQRAQSRSDCCRGEHTIAGISYSFH